MKVNRFLNTALGGQRLEEPLPADYPGQLYRQLIQCERGEGREEGGREGGRTYQHVSAFTLSSAWKAPLCLQNPRPGGKGRPDFLFALLACTNISEVRTRRLESG